MQHLSATGKLLAAKALLVATVGLIFVGHPLSGAIGSVLTLNSTALSQPAQAKRISAGDTIVYVKEDGRELRLIQPDGSNDRLLWRVPASVLDRRSRAWRGDPTANRSPLPVVMTTCSEYGHDIYLIDPDGTQSAPLDQRTGLCRTGSISTGQRQCTNRKPSSQSD